MTIKTSLGASLAVFLLCGSSQVARADSQQRQAVGGDAPTLYTSPVKNALDEMQAFQKLQDMRNRGQLSPSEYQRLIMGLAGGHKVQFDTNPAPAIPPPGNVIVVKPPSPPAKTAQPALAPPQAYRSLLPLPANVKTAKQRQNTLTQIKRPTSGKVRLLQHNQDVARY